MISEIMISELFPFFQSNNDGNENIISQEYLHYLEKSNFNENNNV